MANTINLPFKEIPPERQVISDSPRKHQQYSQRMTAEVQREEAAHEETEKRKKPDEL